ncbi:hypothetical protein F5Y15DRAFT_423443 [Xylariaceae sp. FL0016]|nr:hypothetical protein F5Y15DRAFT_423443 [Xylariaceae sp. FL0016]
MAFPSQISVGYISTYPGYGRSTTRPFVKTPATTKPWRDLFENFTSSQPVIPLANDTRSDCAAYMWFDDTTDNLAADCWNLATVFGSTSEQFILWNPSLSQNVSTSILLPSKTAAIGSTLVDYTYPCTVSASSSYCVVLAPTMSYNTTTALVTPTPRAAGETDQCTSWFAPKNYTTCQGLMIMFSLNITLFYDWNPSVGPDCDELSVGTYYCVSIYENGDTPPTDDTGPITTTSIGNGSTSASGGSSSIPSSTTGNGVSTPSPVQTGITASCDEFHLVVEGDTCWQLTQDYGISYDQFYGWNPAVGTDCHNLGIDEYVCVGILAMTGASDTATLTDPAVVSTTTASSTMT